MFGRSKEPEEPEPDKQMEELLELQARLDKVKRRFQDMRDTIEKMKDEAGMEEDSIFRTMIGALKRTESEINQTEIDDIKEDKRLQAKLKRDFAKKPKAKPKLTRTQALIEKAKEQGG